MTTHNAENERIKRRYFTYLKEAQGYSEASLDTVAKAIHRFEHYTRFRDFRKFHIEQAVGFKRHLAARKGAATGKPLSKATLSGTLGALRKFFHWLAGEPGFRSRLSYADADYFKLGEKEQRIARARRDRPVPTIDQIFHVIGMMPTETAIERRDRALIAFTLLTGARDRAIVTFKLKHIDLQQGCVHQDARDVATKFSKTFTTWFFPIGGEVREIVTEWIAYLQAELHWGPDDPLFPATRIATGDDRRFQPAGLQRRHWTGTSAVRRIFKTAFAQAGLPYFNPHSFRNTLAVLGEKRCRTPEQFKAWSQNLGHEKVMTTFTSYGKVAPTRQAEIIRGLIAGSGSDADAEALARQLVAAVKATT